MNAKVTIALVAALAAGFVVGLNSGRSSDRVLNERISDLEGIRAERDGALQTASRLEDEVERIRRRATDAEGALTSARQELAKIEDERQAAAEAAAAKAAAEEAAEEAASEAHAGMAFPGNHQRFSFPEYDEALGEVDWSDVGENASKMLPALGKLVEGIASGEQPDPETVGSIQKYNGALVVVALKLNQKLPGGQANGAYTHPSAMVNSIAATLDAAGMPLDVSQLKALLRIGSKYADEEKARVAAYDDQTFELRKLFEESRLKHRFFTDAFAELNQHQRDTLSPEATRGRTRVDLFSEGLIWAASTGKIPFEDRDGYAAAVQSRIERALSLTDEQKGEAGTLISEWVSSLPNRLFVVEPDALWDASMIPASFVEEVAGHQVELMQRIYEGLDLTDAARSRLRGSRGVMVPFLKTEPAAE